MSLSHTALLFPLSFTHSSKVSKVVTVYPHLGTQMLSENAVHIRTLSTNPYSIFPSSTPLLFLIRGKREHLWQHVIVFSDAYCSKFRNLSQALVSATH